jgi:hypothetical protein
MFLLADVFQNLLLCNGDGLIGDFIQKIVDALEFSDFIQNGAISSLVRLWKEARRICARSSRRMSSDVR